MAVVSGSSITAFVTGNAAVLAADNASLPTDQQDWAPLQAFIETAGRDGSVSRLVIVDGAGIVRAASDSRLVGSSTSRHAAREAIASDQPHRRHGRAGRLPLRQPDPLRRRRFRQGRSRAAPCAAGCGDRHQPQPADRAVDLRDGGRAGDRLAQRRPDRTPAAPLAPGARRRGGGQFRLPHLASPARRVRRDLRCLQPRRRRTGTPSGRRAGGTRKIR